MGRWGKVRCNCGVTQMGMHVAALWIVDGERRAQCGYRGTA